MQFTAVGWGVMTTRSWWTGKYAQPFSACKQLRMQSSRASEPGGCRNPSRFGNIPQFVVPRRSCFWISSVGRTFLHSDRCFGIAPCHCLSVCLPVSGLAAMCVLVSAVLWKMLHGQGLQSCWLFAFPHGWSICWCLPVCLCCVCSLHYLKGSGSKAGEQESGNFKVLLFRRLVLWLLDLCTPMQTYVVWNSRFWCMAVLGVV